MPLREMIFSDRDTAMKARDEKSLSTLRMLCSAIKNEEIETKALLLDEAVRALVARQVKQQKDAIQDFEQGNRQDLVERAQEEIAVLSIYLPEQLSDAALRRLVQTVIANTPEPHDIGRLMGAVMKEVNGMADGKTVRTIVAEFLE